MKLKTICKDKCGDIAMLIKKNSPQIMTTVGVVGLVSGTVLACIATVNASNKLKEMESKAKQIRNNEYNSTVAHEIVPDTKKELRNLYLKTGVDIAKTYAPSIVIYGTSLTLLLGANNILKKRNVRLATAYTALNKAFKTYRYRVVEKIGKEADNEFRYGVKKREVEETTTDENGKVSKTKKTINIVDVDEISEYAKFFDEYCPNWDKNPEYNLFFLRNQQSYANKVLKDKGYLFLNDVYELIGLPRTKTGQIVGWIYDPDSIVSDNYIDFGLYDQNNEQARLFVNGKERSILLDFNVDGPILDLIDTIKK